MPGPHEMRTIRVKPGAKEALGFAPHADIDAALERAREMTRNAQRRMENIWDQSRMNRRRQAWTADAAFATWFGTDALTKSQMRRMLRRIRRMRRRVHRHVRIVVHPQTGPNSGRCSAASTPNAYKLVTPGIHLCPNFWANLGATAAFTQADRQAAVLIHELRHRGGIPGSMWHFGAAQPGPAQALAASNPRRARRNPENWENFMLQM